MITDRTETAVVLAGDRPTGPLHLGHLAGTLRTRLLLQERHPCTFLVADLHLLTTNPERTRETRPHVLDVVLDWMSVGLDPDRSAFVLQSRVPEIGELAVILSMLCSVERVARIPSYREAAENGAARERASVGRLCYPILMAADILLFGATLVPVGEDQLSHLELVRELARRFNRLYGTSFAEPSALLSSTPRLVGIDGRRKMSKSLANAINLADPPQLVARKVRSMYTDPQRIRADVPGRVEGNPVFAYHDAFNADAAEVQDLKDRYRRGKVGDVEVKDRLIRALNALLAPIRERRRSLEGRPEEIREILLEGSRRARRIARENLAGVIDRMGLDPLPQEPGAAA